MNGEHSGLALTVQQPWASALIAPVERYTNAMISGWAPVPKRVENRSWMPPSSVVGRRIWIHAGKTFDEDGALTCALRGFAPPDDTLPRGAIIGDALLSGYVYRRAHGYRLVGKTPPGEHVMESLWWVGPCGWVLDDVRELLTPRYWRGQQGLWKVPESLHEECLHALEQSRSCAAHADCDMADELAPEWGAEHAGAP